MKFFNKDLTLDPLINFNISLACMWLKGLGTKNNNKKTE